MKAGRWSRAASEAAASLLAAWLFTLSCYHIGVNPLDRIGQISGLASLCLRFTIASLALISILVVASRWRGGVWFGRTANLVCAALAGIASGFIAGGIIVALQGTHFGLNGAEGDSGALISWAKGIDMPASYPPLMPKLLHWYSELRGIPEHFGLKGFQIYGTALIGPATYLAWRTLLRAPWALGIGLLASLPLIESSPYKPYGNPTLIVMLPLLVCFLDIVRRAADKDPLWLTKRGVLYGAMFGVLLLNYSGWFQWSAPGVVAATLVMFPWRKAPGRAGLFIGVAATVMLLLSARYLAGAFGGGALSDGYIYFDVLVEPAYIAMFKGDLPGQIANWPPFGELGGVGLFTILLAAGLGLAIAFGRSRTFVITAASIMAGAWLWRFWIAHQLFDTKLVQLYPRTTQVILYCLLALTGYAIFLASERHRRSATDSPLHSTSGVIGAVCGLALVLGSAASWIANEYMPASAYPFAPGRLAWTAQHYKDFKWGQDPR